MNHKVWRKPLHKRKVVSYSEIINYMHIFPTSPCYTSGIIANTLNYIIKKKIKLPHNIIKKMCVHRNTVYEYGTPFSKILREMLRQGSHVRPSLPQV